MKKIRSLSVLKANIHINPNRKLIFKDPCFTNHFEGAVLQKDVYTHNLFKRYFGSESTNKNKPRKILKRNYSRNGPNEVIISPYCLKTNTYNNIFNSSLEKTQLKENSNPYKNKYGKLNFGSYKSLTQFSLKKSITIFNSNNPIPVITPLDNFNIMFHQSIDKIDERYKKKLCMRDPLPNMFANKRGIIQCKKMKNKFIKAKFQSKVI